MIKFRVWDTVKKAMSEVQAIVFTEEKVYPIYFKEIRRYIPFSEAILMQSTGLTDEDGNDVYQGDVIDIFYEDYPMGYYRENHLIGVVDLDETGTSWIIKNAKYDFDIPGKMPNDIGALPISVDLPDEETLEEIFLHEFNLEPEDILILGNVWENPELQEAPNGQN